MTTRWFRRRWDERRGDHFDSWGAATYFFEVDAEGWPTRQIEDYENGPTLRYGPDHQEDQYGQLGQVRLDDLEEQAAAAADGASESSRLDGLADAAQRALDDARQAQAEAQNAAATQARGADVTIAEQTRRAEQAAEDATRAAIRAERQASRQFASE